MSPSWLLDRLRAYRCRPALVWQGRDFSYLELLQAVEKWSEHLAAFDIREGDCVGLRGSYSPAACSLLLALVNNRNIIVPLSGKADKDVSSLLDVACVGTVFSFDAHDAWTSEHRQLSQEPALFQDLRDRHAAGLILFTSGSTGVSKAALLDFDRFDADGWLNTGDVVLTKGDYLRILGRASEAINVGGEKVFPAEVESVLLQVSNVSEVTVYGRPNPVTGNVVAAAVLLFQPEDPEGLEQRVRQFCKGRLERYKVPVVVELGEAEQHNARFKKIRNPRGSAAP